MKAICTNAGTHWATTAYDTGDCSGPVSASNKALQGTSGACNNLDGKDSASNVDTINNIKPPHLAWQGEEINFLKANPIKTVYI